MKVAVLGTGEMGITVIKHLKSCSEVSEIIGYDISRNALNKVKELGDVIATDDLNLALEDKEIELVFITASNDAHKSLLIKCIEADKAVMCEKPIATNLHDVQDMIDIAERRKSFLQIGYELRYSKLYTKIKEWIDKDLLGQIVNVHCTYIISEFYGKDSWRVKTNRSGSMVGEKLCHYIDLPRWWTGSDIQEVYAVCAPNVVPYFEIHDNYNITCTHENGAVSHINFMMAPASTFSGDPLQNTVDQQQGDGHELRFLVVGTKGAAQTDVFGRQIKRWTFGESAKGFTSTLVEELSWPKKEDHLYFHNTTDQTKDIVRRVSQNLAPGLTINDAFETTKTCFAVDESVNKGEAVKVSKVANISA